MFFVTSIVYMAFALCLCVYTILKFNAFHSALEDTISVFPGRVNTDIIFGRPGQSLSSWTKELKNVSDWHYHDYDT